MVRWRVFAGVLLILFVSVPWGSPIHGQTTSYPETIAVLTAAYQNEMRAYLNYMAYARKAQAEGYPNLSYLFVSFATAESIHARNFRQVLSTLGVEIEEPRNGSTSASGSRTNLKSALEFEMLDIDRRYPDLIDRARRTENHEAAIRHLTYSWDTEKQHRDLIKKMQSGTGIFFGMLTKRIESTTVEYSVCGVCGSTVIARPEQVCPICKSPATEYRALERLK